jgi:hypothetical protein
MEANPARSGALLKMYRHRVRDLLLQVAEVLPLRCDAACATRIIPRGNEPARLLVTLDLKGDFFHGLEPIIPYLPAGLPPLGIPKRDQFYRVEAIPPLGTLNLGWIVDPEFSANCEHNGFYFLLKF